MLDGLLPLLQAIPPESLASTLGALSQALDGRGEQLGVTLDQLDTIFAGVNTRMPDLQAGPAELRDVHADLFGRGAAARRRPRQPAHHQRDDRAGAPVDRRAHLVGDVDGFEHRRSVDDEIVTR